jgi:hypothetical protein
MEFSANTPVDPKIPHILELYQLKSDIIYLEAKGVETEKSECSVNE